MREYPLTNKQIEICNYLLSINQQSVNLEKLKTGGHVDRDIIIVQYFLKDNKFIYAANPVVLTEKGTKYSKKGIVKYFKEQRRNEFFNSIIVKTVAVWTGIFISLSIGITNYFQNQVNKRGDVIYIKHSEIDSILYEKGFQKSNSPEDNFAIKELEKDSSNQVE